MIVVGMSSKVCDKASLERGIVSQFTTTPALAVPCVRACVRACVCVVHLAYLRGDRYWDTGNVPVVDHGRHVRMRKCTCSEELGLAA